MGLEEATILACAQAALSAVREADVACDYLDAEQPEPASKHAQAAVRAAARAANQAASVRAQLPAKARRARLVQKAAQAAMEAALGASNAEIDTSDLDRVLGRAQRSALALFELVGATPPEKPIAYQ